MPIGKLTDRYEVKQTLGQGGMGIVYWAYDTQIRRDVALKTIRDAPEKAALELFHKECNTLASISHPNIIEIFDIGKFEEEGAEKPYFVMPLLKGVTLDSLIRNSSARLTVERTVDILCQACRGLQAAHEHGLVHRDLKPSNIFVLEDDSVKIIDFGVAHMAGAGTASSPKGTLFYMAPEQIQFKPASALSDIFTLGVVAYETLTLRRPFEGATYRDVAHAILHHIPPPASELNPKVSPLLGRVVHKTMAKQPWNRFSTARELAEAFQKALRNEPIESFDSAKILPRIERAAKAFESGDHQFASEILTELESEGHLAPEMAPLRLKIDQATKQKTLAQLLESARTRIEDQEYPLALQKVREALEIDPENAEALRLQQEIESHRSNGQVEEWFRLARQYLDRFDFKHARQAVDNVLQLRATDTQAVDLAAEIERREQQYLEQRQEKERLYRSAVQAHEGAELTVALSKMERVLELDRKALDISSTEPDASYQSFYNQIRSEKDAGTSAYAEARRCLDEGNFNRALEISEEALKKSPGQALFQALKLDIEDQKRRRLTAYIAEVDRNLAAEPDLDKRVEILRSATAQFPEEQHFERTLQLMREKRDLVDSIAAEARRQEEQGQFSEALSQWEILRTVYGQYPGLESEIERISKLGDQHVSDEASVRRIEQINRLIESRDYARAASLLREAQAESPGDARLLEMETLLRQAEERKASTQALVDQGRAFCVHGRFEQAASLFRKAYQVDERDLAVRALLVDALVQRARSLLDRNWKYSNLLVQSALELDPNNVQARSISALIADRERDEAIDQCINRARQLQSSGDTAGALATVEEALVLYPTAARLVELQATLQKSSADTGDTTARRLDLEKLTQLEARAETATDANEQREILTGVRALAARYLDDPEFQTVLIAMEKRYVALNRAAPPPPVVEPVYSDATTLVPINLLAQVPSMPTPVPAAKPPEVPAPVVIPPAMKTAVASETSTPVTAPRRPTPDTTPDAPPPPPRIPPVPKISRAPLPPLPPAPQQPARDWRFWGAFAAGFALVALLGIGIVLWRQQQAKSPRSVTTAVATFPVDVRTVPEGATVLVNDKPSGTSNLQLKLVPGFYRLTAVRDGYQPSKTTLTVTAGHGASAGITLQAMPATLRLLTDFASPSITFDGHPQNNLQSGQLTLENVAAGSHTLTIGSGSSSAAIHFDAREGEPPVVSSLDAAKDTSAVLITNLGSRARIYSSRKAGAVTFDGKPAGSIDPSGVELTNVGPGDHEITIGEGDERRKVVYETALVPALTVYLNNNALQTVGTLLVTTGEDDVQVSIDGKPVRQATRRGQLRIPNLPAKQYVVSVAKDGFQPVAPQRVTVTKGEEAKAAFQLHPAPAISTLHIAGAMPGTLVLLDGKPSGTVGQDGTIQAVQVPSGSHTVQLHKDEYKPKTFQLNFVGGKDVTLTGADVALEGTFGTLVVAVAPEGAQLTILRSGDAQPRSLTANSVHLAEGSYTVTATSPRFMPQSTTVEIAAGSTRNVTLQLSPERVVAPPKPVAAHLGMSGWQFPAAWQPEGDHFTRKGGNLCLYSQQGPGSYTFTASMKRGKQLRWVAHVVNDKNYVEFELDGDYYYRREVIDGRSRELLKKKHGLAMQQSVAATLQVKVSPAGIVQSIQKPAGWTVLDTWMDPALFAGRFGFLIRGRDEVNLSAFWFSGSE